MKIKSIILPIILILVLITTTGCSASKEHLSKDERWIVGTWSGTFETDYEDKSLTINFNKDKTYSTVNSDEGAISGYYRIVNNVLTVANSNNFQPSVSYSFSFKDKNHLTFNNADEHYILEKQ